MYIILSMCCLAPPRMSLMMLSCSFIAAIIVFRLPWTWRCSKKLMKFIHAGLHLLAFVLTVISMVAVFDFHNTAKIPNMYSLHSWLGLTALILYTLQVNELPFHVSFLTTSIHVFFSTRTSTTGWLYSPLLSRFFLESLCTWCHVHQYPGELHSCQYTSTPVFSFSSLW